MNGITRETYMHLEPDDKLAVLFDYVSDIRSRLASECPQRQEECNQRFDKIEHRKWINTAASGAGGIVGGFIAILAKWILSPKG